MFSSSVLTGAKTSPQAFLLEHGTRNAHLVDKIPAIIPLGKEDYGIRFFGIPSGYEYASLIEAILDVSKGQTSLSQKTNYLLERLAMS